jgi:UDP-N-acetylmuramoylalanine--D-glutamate ligase
MKIGIVGWGLEGQSAFRFYGAGHDYLIVSEEPRDDFPKEDKHLRVQFLSNQRPAGLTGNVADLSYLDGLDACDKIIYTAPAAKNLEKKFGKDADFWSKATTIQHLFFEQVRTKNIIGVTGTKGKGTTSSLIYEMLKAAGKRAFLGGNIGVPVLDFVSDVMPDDWVVLELSNFQLYNLTYSPHIAVCLMISPEHMDWHPDIKDYTESKANIFRHQKPDDIAIYFADNQHSKKLADYSAGQKIPYYHPPGAYLNQYAKIAIGETEVIDKSEIKLLGEHNLQNICAALTAVWFSLSEVEDHIKVDAARKVLSTFAGLEHRLEFARELDGVKYYDDSFGTTPETAIVAMKSFEAPKIMILGGSDKGAEFDELAEAVKHSNLKHAIVIGQIADKIVGSLKQAGYTKITTGLTTMPEIVQKARELSQPGDVVLLSAAAASFGLFKDYKDRGNQFKAAVQALA